MPSMELLYCSVHASNFRADIFVKNGHRSNKIWRVYYRLKVYEERAKLLEEEKQQISEHADELQISIKVSCKLEFCWPTKVELCRRGFSICD